MALDTPLEILSLDSNAMYHIPLPPVCSEDVNCEDLLRFFISNFWVWPKAPDSRENTTARQSRHSMGPNAPVFYYLRVAHIHSFWYSMSQSTWGTKGINGQNQDGIPHSGHGSQVSAKHENALSMWNSLRQPFITNCWLNAVKRCILATEADPDRSNPFHQNNNWSSLVQVR